MENNVWKFEMMDRDSLSMWNGDVKYTLSFQNRWHWRTPHLDGYRIVCNRSVWKESGNFMVSHGLGKYITVMEEAGARRMKSKLKKLAESFTTEQLESAFSGVKNFTAGGVLLVDEMEV